MFFSAVKDEDSDMDVPEDEGSDSDMEECRPSKPRPTRNGIMAGTQKRDRALLLIVNYKLLVKMLLLSRELNAAFVCTVGRGARFIGNMQGGDTDEVSIVTSSSIQDSFPFCRLFSCCFCSHWPLMVLSLLSLSPHNDMLFTFFCHF